VTASAAPEIVHWVFHAWHAGLPLGGIVAGAVIIYVISRD
jgi:hypothetical protein